MKNPVKVAAALAVLATVFAFGRMTSQPATTSVQVAPQHQTVEASQVSSSERQPLPLPADLKPNEKGIILSPLIAMAGKMDNDTWLITEVKPILQDGSTAGIGFMLQGPQNSDIEFYEVFKRHPQYATFQTLRAGNRIATMCAPGARPTIYEGDPPLNRSDFTEVYMAS